MCFVEKFRVLQQHRGNDGGEMLERRSDGALHVIAQAMLEFLANELEGATSPRI